MEMGCDVVALKVERSFLEKATISARRASSRFQNADTKSLLAALRRHGGDGESARNGACIGGERRAFAGGGLEIAILCQELGALRFGTAGNIPAHAASGTPGRVGAGLSGDAGYVP
jgi:hypothetical protein